MSLTGTPGVGESCTCSQPDRCGTAKEGHECTGETAQEVNPMVTGNCLPPLKEKKNFFLVFIFF